jgi:hypothetical protein
MAVVARYRHRGGKAIVARTVKCIGHGFEILGLGFKIFGGYTDARHNSLFCCKNTHSAK